VSSILTHVEINEILRTNHSQRALASDSITQ